MRADLDLDRLAPGADDRRVQRLVHVELRHRDVVLEAPRHRVPPGVQRPERGVAVAHRLHEHAHRDEVVDLLEVAAPDDHLLVDGVVVLGPAGDGRLDLRRAQVGADLVAHRREVLLTSRRPLGDEPDDLVVDLGVERLEGQVLELPLDGVHAEPVGQRGVDLQGLLGLARGALLRHVAPGAGVVEAVGQLDDEHPDVAGHGDDHLAHRLGLGGLAVGHLVELGDSVDEHRDLVAEVAAQRLEAVGGVLHRVVQQRRRQRGRGHAELGEDRRHGQRVGDVVVTRAALLALVRPLGDGVGPLDEAEVGLGVRVAHHLQERLEDGVLGGAVAPDEGQRSPGPGARGQPGGRRARRGRRAVLRHAGSVVVSHRCAGPGPSASALGLRGCGEAGCAGRPGRTCARPGR